MKDLFEENDKMAKDDIALGEELGKLEIEHVKIVKPAKEENPFVPNSLVLQKRNGVTKASQQNLKCSCTSQKRIKNLTISKKKNNKILKEPILKLLLVNGQACNAEEDCNHICNKKTLPEITNPDSLCALVDNCNQLKISGTNEQISLAQEQSNETRWWKNGVLCSRQPRETSTPMSQAGSCSQQALNPPCDVTIDELASYFETLVHIPKKMSSMAEMMYI